MRSNIIRVICILIWPVLYIGTRSYETTFIFLAVVAAIGLWLSSKRENTEKEEKWKILYYLLIFLASLAFVLADYSMFLGKGILGIIEAFFALITGMVVWDCVFKLISVMGYKSYSEDRSDNDCRKLCIFSGLFSAFINIIFLFTTIYPGYVQPDSCEQLREILEKDYANLNPIWHTKFIEIVFGPVYKLSGNGNAAIACFCIFQIILFACALMYVVWTLYEIGINKKIILVYITLYSIMPQNIIMPSSLVKDSAFALGCMLWVTSLYRITNRLQREKVNYAVYILSTFMCCLFRKNGMIAIEAITVLILLTCWKKQYKALCICALVTVLLSAVLDKVVIDHLGFSQPDAVESLHIPLQQIARVGVDKKELTDYEKNYIENVCDYEGLVSVYNPQNADYVKNYIRYHGDKQYIEENKIEFFKVWLSIGVHHPVNYLKAWVDQTWGVWSGSTFYSTWEGTVSDRIPLDQYGIFAIEHNNLVSKGWELWNGLIARNRVGFFEVVLAVGIRFWIIMYGIVHAFRKGKSDYIVGLLPIMIVATLAIATPIGHEFRYAYGVFTTFPIAFWGLMARR